MTKATYKIKHLIGGVMEPESMTIMMGSMSAGRQAGSSSKLYPDWQTERERERGREGKEQTLKNRKTPRAPRNCLSLAHDLNSIKGHCLSDWCRSLFFSRKEQLLINS